MSDIDERLFLLLEDVNLTVPYLDREEGNHYIEKIKALFQHGVCADCRFYIDEECGLSNGPFTLGVMWKPQFSGCTEFKEKP